MNATIIQRRTAFCQRGRVMAGESQRTPDSDPDPSVYVQAAIDRATRAEREWVLSQLAILIQRFNSNDEATRVLSDTINRTPTEIQKEVGHLKELVTESMRSAEALVKYQTECSDKASTKQEAAFTKQMDSLTVLLQKMDGTLGDRINDNKTRIDRIEANGIGATNQRTEARQSNAAFYATVGMGLTLILAAITIIGFIAANSPG